MCEQAKNDNGNIWKYVDIRYVPFFLIVSSLILTFFIFLITRGAIFPEFDYSKTGEIGDTIGGVSAPFIGMIGVFLTFAAFYIQYKANQTHIEQFVQQYDKEQKNEARDICKWLIEKNREIANQVHVNDMKGASCFSLLCQEYELTYRIAKIFFEEILDNSAIINISYVVFLNGVGPISDKINRDLFSHVSGFDEFIEQLKSSKRNIEYAISAKSAEHLETSIEDKFFSMGYAPFEGHNTTLGHYFRNIYHLLKEVDSYSHGNLNLHEKYQLVKHLRTQMSTYEQVILYFNSLSVYGRPLKEEGYIEKYKLVKNIPFPLVEFAGDIKGNYGDVEFEWDEIRARSE
ncbi:hypothetical protein BVX95_00365 [archaeon D22]|nr:hypothetical protein BVX95_00365 [archaeon D22]